MESSTVERARSRVTPMRRRLAWSMRVGALGILLLPLANCRGGADHPVTASREQTPAGAVIVGAAAGTHTDEATASGGPGATWPVG